MPAVALKRDLQRQAPARGEFWKLPNKANRASQSLAWFLTGVVSLVARSPFSRPRSTS